MMRIGDRHYEFVRSQSGFSVTLEPALSVRGPQAWRLDLHYVPADRNLEARPSWELEHLELCFQPFRYQTSDWRERPNLGPGPPFPLVPFYLLPTAISRRVLPGNWSISNFASSRFAIKPPTGANAPTSALAPTSTRFSSTSPSAIFWTEDSVARVTPSSPKPSPSITPAAIFSAASSRESSPATAKNWTWNWKRRCRSSRCAYGLAHFRQRSSYSSSRSCQALLVNAGSELRLA